MWRARSLPLSADTGKRTSLSAGDARSRSRNWCGGAKASCPLKSLGQAARRLGGRAGPGRRRRSWRWSRQDCGTQGNSTSARGPRRRFNLKSVRLQEERLPRPGQKRGRPLPSHTKNLRRLKPCRKAFVAERGLRNPPSQRPPVRRSMNFESRRKHPEPRRQRRLARPPPPLNKPDGAE